MIASSIHETSQTHMRAFPRPLGKGATIRFAGITPRGAFNYDGSVGIMAGLILTSKKRSMFMIMLVLSDISRDWLCC